MDCFWFKSHHCRSCELLDMSYEQTIAHKEKNLLSLFAGVSLNLAPSVGLESRVSGSRNKVKLAVNESDNQIEFGHFKSDLSFTKLEECPLHMDGLNGLLPLLKEKLQSYKINPYSVHEKKGELKYIILSKSISNGSILLRFVLRSKESLDRLRKLSADICLMNPQIKVVTANLQPEHKAILEGEEEIILSVEDKIEHSFGDVHLELGPRSFFQVTPEVAGVLYQTVGELVKKWDVKSFLDLYCGVGAFSFFAAKHCPEVLGVEISKDAIISAKKSISKNQISAEIDFKSLDVEEFLKLSKKKFEAILVNPPRRGLNETIINSLLSLEPQFIFYSSCNAQTLYRDYQLLSKNYEISHVQLYDMFPFTEHFETLMVLSRKGA